MVDQVAACCHESIEGADMQEGSKNKPPLSTLTNENENVHHSYQNSPTNSSSTSPRIFASELISPVKHGATMIKGLAMAHTGQKKRQETHKSLPSLQRMFFLCNTKTQGTDTQWPDKMPSHPPRSSPKKSTGEAVFDCGADPAQPHHGSVS